MEGFLEIFEEMIFKLTSSKKIAQQTCLGPMVFQVPRTSLHLVMFIPVLKKDGKTSI